MGTAALIGGSLLASHLSSESAADSSERQAAGARGESGRQYDESMRRLDEAVQYLKDMGVPDVEAQKVALEYAQLGPSALEDVAVDPRLKSAEMDALRAMQQYGEGPTAQQKADEMMMMNRTAAQAQARDKSILQNMAERGMGGSGAELAARIGSSQAQAQNAALAQAQLAGQRQDAKMAAIQSAGQMAGSMGARDYGQQANLASARDRIEQFNKQQRAGTLNQQEMYNKQLQQRQFENELAKRKSVASAQTNTAQSGIERAGQTLQAGMDRAQGELNKGAATSQLIGSLGGAAIQKWGADGGVMGTAGFNTGYEDGGVLGTAGYQYADGGSIDAPNSNGGFAGGGLPVPDSGMDEEQRYLEGDVVPGDSFEGDRVDAKVNSGEMVLNIEQQQRLMELLKGLRDLKGLGDEDILESPDGSQIPDDVPEAVKQGELQRAPMPPELEMENGGMVPSEYKTPTEAKPRGIHASLRHEQAEEEKSNVQSKQRKARIKAYETLINGGR